MRYECEGCGRLICNHLRGVHNKACGRKNHKKWDEIKAKADPVKYITDKCEDAINQYMAGDPISAEKVLDAIAVLKGIEHVQEMS